RCLRAVPSLRRLRHPHRAQRPALRHPRTQAPGRESGRRRHARLLRHTAARTVAVARGGDAGRSRASLRHRLRARPSCARRRRHIGARLSRAREAAGDPRAQSHPTQRYASAVARLRALIEGCPPVLDAAIDQLLERIALSSSDDEAASHDRINLLTLHSTKGLEFSRVYIVGVEDYEIPGYQAATNNIKDEIEEARRLLYVGMTRARDRLILTRAARRFGRDAGGSTFLEEMNLGTLDLRDPNLRPALL